MRDSASREILRVSILRVLDANATRYGLTLAAIQVHLQTTYAVKADPAEVGRELEYLKDKELAAQPDKLISPENTAWSITAKGRDLLAQQDK